MKCVTAAEMRELDRRATEEFGIPSLVLMEHAGRAVAERVKALLCEEGKSAGPVSVFCGKGNNGGDGFVAARHLHNAGVGVECWLTSPADAVHGDAEINLEITRRLGIPLHILSGSTVPAFWGVAVVDALLGTGIRGEVTGVIGRCVDLINDSRLPVVAVDVPSGLNADTGQLANRCVRAMATVTFGLPKLGLLVYPGREVAGELTVADISFPPELAADEGLQHEWVTAERLRELLPRRPVDAHKGDSGRILVIAGSPGLTGAAAMCGASALRAGGGLVTLAIPASLNPILEAKLDEVMTLPVAESGAGCHCADSLDELTPRIASADAVAIGPGLGSHPATGELVRGLLSRCAGPVVIDADGLNLAAPADASTFPDSAVITPHPGEMARLLETSIEEVQSNRIETARQAAKRLGCVVVLKGAATITAAPDGRAAINSSGGPALATGGTGDVLTGIIVAFLAAGLVGYEAALAGAHVHGLAGDLAGERIGVPGVVAGDVTASIPEAIRRIRHERG